MCGFDKRMLPTAETSVVGSWAGENQRCSLQRIRSNGLRNMYIRAMISAAMMYQNAADLKLCQVEVLG